jgi:ABC-2 type transport system ATP-binding protein
MPTSWDMKNLISIKNLTFEIPYVGIILENINLEIGKGEFVGLVGHNGAGKTTLIDLILGLKTTKQGEIFVIGEDPAVGSKDLKKKISFFSQNIYHKTDITVASFLEFHSKFYPQYSKQDESYLLETFELDLKKNIGTLSTGQQKKVQFVAGLSTQPQLIIVDEVTAVLDPIERRTFFKQLLKWKEERSCTILLATNIAEDLPGNVDKAMFLKNKEITEIEVNQILNYFEGNKIA